MRRGALLPHSLTQLPTATHSLTDALHGGMATRTSTGSGSRQDWGRTIIQLSHARVNRALLKVRPGLAKYCWLQAELRPMRRLGIMLSFQRRFNGFYVVRRNREWRQMFFRLLEQHKAGSVSFGSTLRTLHEKTGRVEASFASKLVATIDPLQPVIDSVVLKNVGLRLPSAGTSRRLERTVELHDKLSTRYLDFLGTDAGQFVVARFDATVSEGWGHRREEARPGSLASARRGLVSRRGRSRIRRTPTAGHTTLLDAPSCPCSATGPSASFPRPFVSQRPTGEPQVSSFPASRAGPRGCHRRTARLPTRFARFQRFVTVPAFPRLPGPGASRFPSRQGCAGPLRSVKAEPATPNRGRNHRLHSPPKSSAILFTTYEGIKYAVPY